MFSARCLLIPVKTCKVLLSFRKYGMKIWIRSILWLPGNNPLSSPWHQYLYNDKAEKIIVWWSVFFILCKRLALKRRKQSSGKELRATSSAFYSLSGTACKKFHYSYKCCDSIASSFHVTLSINKHALMDFLTKIKESIIQTKSFSKTCF